MKPFPFRQIIRKFSAECRPKKPSCCSKKNKTCTKIDNTKVECLLGNTNKSTGGSLAVWRNLSLFVFLPAIAACYYHVFGHEHEHKRPKFIKYEYLHIRTKKFPWGRDTSLFHNPKLNPLPDTGYEDENEEESDNKGDCQPPEQAAENDKEKTS